MSTSKTRFKPETVTFQTGAHSTVTLTLTHGRKGYFLRQKEGASTHESLPFETIEQARRAWPEWFKPLAIEAAKAGFPLEAERKKTGRKIPCPGEAHKNAFIDHCMCCLGGTWGEVDEYAPIDIEFAREARLDVPCPSLTTEQFHEMRKLEEAGEVEMVSLHTRSSYYSGYRWK